MDYLEGSTLISADVLKIVELYNKKIIEDIINLNMKKDFSLTISTNKDINYRKLGVDSRCGDSR